MKNGCRTFIWGLEGRGRGVKRADGCYYGRTDRGVLRRHLFCSNQTLENRENEEFARMGPVKRGKMVSSERRDALDYEIKDY